MQIQHTEEVMKNELKTQLMQGLLMAAVVATALPCFDMAVVGAVLAGGGIMKLRQHAENPTNAPLSHGLGRLGAGAGLLVLPSLAGMLSQTANSTGVNGTATIQTFGF
jgi:hypothetical protein